MKYLIKRKNDDLVHDGIIGMKWGHRRYQNKDGSLTEEGRKRYGVKKGKDKSEQDMYDKSFIEKQELKELGTGSKIANDIKQGFYQAENLIPYKKGQIQNKYITKYKKTKYKNLSDAELNKRINRIRLETTYGDLNEDNVYVKSGSEKFREAMQSGGALAGLTVAALNVAQGFKRLITGEFGGKKDK